MYAVENENHGSKPSEHFFFFSYLQIAECCILLVASPTLASREDEYNGL